MDTATAHQGTLVAAIQLGWRVAELYSLTDDPGEPVEEDLLPGHASLQEADQLELQLRAAAGDARRAGVTSTGASLEAPEILELARKAPGSAGARARFRAGLRRCHVEIAKDLWAFDEAAGKAYELGNGLSDTFGLVCRAYREPGADLRAAWTRVFAAHRVERLKVLLDDLQSRLHPAGVAVVRRQLDEWSREVPERMERAGVPEERRVRHGLRRQTVIWRQLIAGDKDPEAYLDREARADLRDELRALVWKRSRRVVLPLAALLLALIVAAPRLVDLYTAGWLKSGLVSTLVALAGAAGITKASVLLTIRKQLEDWSRLLWSRSVVQAVADRTLALDEVWEPAPAPRAAPLRSLRVSVQPPAWARQRPAATV